jgi:hypothetical protein
MSPASFSKDLRSFPSPAPFFPITGCRQGGDPQKGRRPVSSAKEVSASDPPKPKSEARNSKQIQMTKRKIQNEYLNIWILNFAFVSDFDIRISNFLPGYPVPVAAAADELGR